MKTGPPGGGPASSVVTAFLLHSAKSTAVSRHVSGAIRLLIGAFAAIAVVVAVIGVFVETAAAGAIRANAPVDAAGIHAIHVSGLISGIGAPTVSTVPSRSTVAAPPARTGVGIASSAIGISPARRPLVRIRIVRVRIVSSVRVSGAPATGTFNRVWVGGTVGGYGAPPTGTLSRIGIVDTAGVCGTPARRSLRRAPASVATCIAIAGPITVLGASLIVVTPNMRISLTRGVRITTLLRISTSPNLGPRPPQSPATKARANAIFCQ